MNKRRDIDEKASRADDRKGTAHPTDNRGGRVSDGKDEDTPQGGKRRGPGRWVDPEAASGD